MLNIEAERKERDQREAELVAAVEEANRKAAEREARLADQAEFFSFQPVDERPSKRLVEAVRKIGGKSKNEYIIKLTIDEDGTSHFAVQVETPKTDDTMFTTTSN